MYLNDFFLNAVHSLHNLCFIFLIENIVTSYLIQFSFGAILESETKYKKQKTSLKATFGVLLLHKE